MCVAHPWSLYPCDSITVPQSPPHRMRPQPWLCPVALWDRVAVTVGCGPPWPEQGRCCSATVNEEHWVKSLACGYSSACDHSHVDTMLWGRVFRGRDTIIKRALEAGGRGCFPKHQAPLQKPCCVPLDCQRQTINNVVAVCSCQGPGGGRPAAACCSIIEQIWEQT